MNIAKKIAVRLLSLFLSLTLTLSLFSCKRETPPPEEDNSDIPPQNEEVKSENAFREEPALGGFYSAIVDNKSVRPSQLVIVPPYRYNAASSIARQSKAYQISDGEIVDYVYGLLDEVEKHCELADYQTALKELPDEQIILAVVSPLVDRASVYILYGYYTFRVSIYENYVVITNLKKTVIFRTDTSMRSAIEELELIAQTGMELPYISEYRNII